MTNIIDKISLTGKTYLEAYRSMKRQYSPDKLHLMRNKKLRHLVEYSYYNIKYYRELFDKSGITPSDIKTLEDIEKIPITTKQDLRSRFWDFLPHNMPKCRVYRTSGSTGVPVCIFSDDNSRLHNSAAVIRSRSAMGLPFASHPILTLLKNETEPIFKAPHWTYLQGIHKTYYINPYIDSDENIEYANNILRLLKKPAIISITPALACFAEKVNKGVFFKPDDPCSLSTVGDTLSQQTRCSIESVFGVMVNDVYACSEIGEVAWQCSKGEGYHINADNVILEIIKDGMPSNSNEVGEVVVTNLNRFAMPFIRYANGDLSEFLTEECPCGCKLPMLKRIVGRSGQDIQLPNGKKVPWNHLKGFMNHPHVRQFQLVQSKKGDFLVKYVKESGVDSHWLETLLLERFNAILNNQIPIHFACVKTIPPASNGKNKLVFSSYRLS